MLWNKHKLSSCFSNYKIKLSISWSVPCKIGGGGGNGGFFPFFLGGGGLKISLKKPSLGEPQSIFFFLKKGWSCKWLTKKIRKMGYRGTPCQFFFDNTKSNCSYLKVWISFKFTLSPLLLPLRIMCEMFGTCPYLLFDTQSILLNFCTITQFNFSHFIFFF